MKRSDFILGLLVGALAATALFAFIGRKQLGEAGEASVLGRDLKIAHSLPTSHPVHRGIERFAQRLKELSGGQINCAIFPSGQLGSETEYLEKLQSGTLDIAKTSAAPVANFVPRMKLFSLPYLFRDREHYWQVLDGAIGQQLLAKLSDRGSGKPSGFRGLCFYDAGSRNFYSVQPIEEPSDLRGRVIRVMEDPVAIDMMGKFQAIAKPMASGEIYSALQRGNINGAENNPPTFVTQRHYEVCKHFTFDHHSRIPDVLQISSMLWDRLGEQEQSWVLTAARESSRYQRQLWQQESDASVAEMQKHGVTIHRPDPQAFEAVAGRAGEALLDDEVKALRDRIKSLPRT
ncbi:MAG: TRAP transporter substrate-binding protein [Proteobacteria bacterium]|nr:TRAP transporter substrate-binding protein [Pseudomonadota bacterium]